MRSATLDLVPKKEVKPSLKYSVDPQDLICICLILLSYTNAVNASPFYNYYNVCEELDMGREGATEDVGGGGHSLLSPGRFAGPRPASECRLRCRWLVQWNSYLV